jgi:hypothetical protein
VEIPRRVIEQKNALDVKKLLAINVHLQAALAVVCHLNVVM